MGSLKSVSIKYLLSPKQISDRSGCPQQVMSTLSTFWGNSPRPTCMHTLTLLPNPYTILTVSTYTLLPIPVPSPNRRVTMKLWIQVSYREDINGIFEEGKMLFFWVFRHASENRQNWNLIIENGHDLCRHNRVRGKGTSGQRSYLSKVSESRIGH